MNLGILQLSDSALPISGYTHSWGLEAAIQAGRVHDPETLENWTRSWLAHSLGPFEGVFVHAACRATAAGATSQLAHLCRMASASILPPSIRQASREMGDQLLALGQTWAWAASGLETLLSRFSTPVTTWHHPIVFGMLGSLADASPHEVVTAYLHQAALGMIGAGVRAIPVGHTHGQQILAYLQPDLRSLASVVIASDATTAGSCCPQYEVLCDEQTRLYARMFRS